MMIHFSHENDKKSLANMINQGREKERRYEDLIIIGASNANANLQKK